MTTTAPATLTPATMTAADWQALEGVTITAATADSTYSGRMARATAAGDMILEDVTRTRTAGDFAGEMHTVTRRRLWIGDVEWVATLWI